MATFYERYLSLKQSRRSLLCVGLDPDPALIPAGYGVGLKEHSSAGIDPQGAGGGSGCSGDQDCQAYGSGTLGGGITDGIFHFLEDIIDALIDKVVAFKPNLAFYEVLGAQGWELFSRVVAAIRKRDRQALIIADAKRGDVGHTAQFYARTFFERFSCDALTINPYLGMDALAPFLAWPDRALMLLCHTSNPGAGLFQAHGDPPLFLRVAEEVSRRSGSLNNLWLVVGATRCQEDIGRIRQAAPQLPFLVPGVGAQGGDLSAMLAAAGSNALINVGRSLLYAADRREEVKEAACQECSRLTQMMQPFL